MKKFCILLLALTLFIPMLSRNVTAMDADEVSVNSKNFAAGEIISTTAVLMDGETGQVLFDKEMNRKVYPASTTKILTGLLVAERAAPNEMVTVTRSAVDIDEWDSSNIALSVGEELTVDSAMYALMLPSANDAANALAEHVAGTQAQFAAIMNEKAQQMGAGNTHFANAHGLHDDTHYTTAYDMALITRYAVENKQFMNYFSAAKHTIPATNYQPMTRLFTNYQFMLVRENKFYDPVVTGGKVGFTNEAQHTMSTVARKNGRTLICVVMDSPNRFDKFEDTKKLLDYGFNRFRQVTLGAEAFTAGVPFGDGDMVGFRSESDFAAWLRDDLPVDRIRVNFAFPAVYQPADQLPTSVEVLVESMDETLPSLLGSQPLLRETTLDRAQHPVPSPTIPEPEIVGYSSNQLLQPFLWGLGAVLIVFIGLVLLRHYCIQKRHRERLARLNKRVRSNFRNQHLL